MRKLTAAVAVGAALAVPVVTATTASADREARISTAAPIPAWWHYAWYPTLLDCERDGDAKVSQGVAVTYSCDRADNDGFDLYLFTN